MFGFKEDENNIDISKLDISKMVYDKESNIGEIKNKDSIAKVEDFVVAFYDGDTNNCFDEDRYSAEEFKEAYDYYSTYNIGNELDDDYVKLYACVDNKLILLGDHKNS